jgi:hypothetical protein
MAVRRAVCFVAFSLVLAAFSPQALAAGRPAEGFVAPAPAPEAITWLPADADAPAPVPRAWRVDFGGAPVPSIEIPADLDAAVGATEPAQRPRARAFVYSDAYYTRLKIHRWASYATIPLFATEWILGQKLYNFTGGRAVHTAHGWVAGGLAGLFGVNTVTGVWNMMEARKDPNGHTKRLIHGILMLASDAGFMASGLTAPGRRFVDVQQWENARRLHRDVAITSMVTALTGYVIMLVK